MLAEEWKVSNDSRRGEEEEEEEEVGDFNADVDDEVDVDEFRESESQIARSSDIICME